MTVEPSFEIGVISDTHGLFDPKLPRLFDGVEHIHVGRLLADTDKAYGNLKLAGQREQHAGRPGEGQQAGDAVISDAVDDPPLVPPKHIGPGGIAPAHRGAEQVVDPTLADRDGLDHRHAKLGLKPLGV